MISKIIFVAGIDLSGSTVMDLALGTARGVVGLGELDNILFDTKRAAAEEKNGLVQEKTCSCGESGSDCDVWGPTLQFIEKNPGSAFDERLNKLLTQAAGQVSEGVDIAVDSSKESDSLRRILSSLSTLGLSPDDIHVVVLRRGPLYWLASDYRRAKRRHRVRSHRIMRRRLGKWARRYLGLVSLVESHQLHASFINLRHFTMDPAQELNRILLSAGVLDRAVESVDLSQSRSHVLWGSHHRHDSVRSQTITKTEKLTGEEIVRGLLAAALVPTAWRANMILAGKEKVTRRNTHSSVVRKLG